MTGWLDLGAVVSDPWQGRNDSVLWNELLKDVADADAKLYVKLIGLRFAGAELLPDSKFRHRLAMANNATVTKDDVRELLAPHSKTLIHYLMHLGGGKRGL